MWRNVNRLFGRRPRAVAVGAIALTGALALAACSDFDEEQAQVEVEEVYALFTEAVLAGDGPVACALMTEILKEDLFTVGPTMVTPEGGSCEGQMGKQGAVIRDENGGEDPSVALESVDIGLVADDGSQPFAPGGLVAWADAESVVGGQSSPMRFFLIQDDWLVGSLPEPFAPDPVLGGDAGEPASADPQ